MLGMHITKTAEDETALCGQVHVHPLNRYRRYGENTYRGWNDPEGKIVAGLTICTACWRVQHAPRAAASGSREG